MEQIDIKLDIKFARLDELHDGDRALVEEALKATARSYAPYSHFNVGAALRLEDGTLVVGANQENAAFPVTICAERTASLRHMSTIQTPRWCRLPLQHVMPAAMWWPTLLHPAAHAAR